MNQPAHTYLSKLVGKDELELVLHFLIEELQLDKKTLEEAFAVRGELTNLEKETNGGRIPDDLVLRRRAGIRKALQSIISKLPPDATLSNPAATLLRYEQSLLPPTEPTPRARNREIVAKIVYGLFGIMVVLTIFIPVKSFRIEAEIYVDQLSFTQEAGYSYNLAGQALDGLTLSHFEKIILKGDSLAIDESGMGEFDTMAVPQGILEITPLDHPIGTTLPMQGQLVLDDFQALPGASITLACPEGNDSSFLVRFIVVHDSVVMGTFSYLEKLALFPDQVQLTGIEEPLELVSMVDLKLSSPKKYPLECQFLSHPGILSMDLKVSEATELSGSGIKISTLSFFKQDPDMTETRAVSTILKGTIRVQEEGNSPLTVENLQKGTALSLKGDELLDLEAFRITPDSIYVKFSGNVENAFIGPSATSISPFWWKWGAHNYWPTILLLMGLLAVLVYFFPKVAKSWLLNVN